jgi:hypothetical protein
VLLLVGKIWCRMALGTASIVEDRFSTFGCFAELAVNKIWAGYGLERHEVFIYFGHILFRDNRKLDELESCPHRCEGMGSDTRGHGRWEQMGIDKRLGIFVIANTVVSQIPIQPVTACIRVTTRTGLPLLEALAGITEVLLAKLGIRERQVFCEHKMADQVTVISIQVDHADRLGEVLQRIGPVIIGNDFAGAITIQMYTLTQSQEHSEVT